jgi:hypothetical protein
MNTKNCARELNCVLLYQVSLIRAMETKNKNRSFFYLLNCVKRDKASYATSRH